MAVVGQASVEDLVLKMLCDVMPHANCAEWQVAAGQTLRHADQVGDNLPVIDGEPLTCAAKPGHDFVGNHQDSVLVAELAHTLHVAVGWNEDSIRAHNSLEDKSCDGMRAFELNDFLDHRQRYLGRFPSTLNPVIRIENSYYARDSGLRRPAARIASEGDAACGRAVVRAITRHDLVPTREEAGNLDRVLVGFGSAVRKKEGVDIARSDFCKLRSQASAWLGCHEGISVSEYGSLLIDCLNDPFVAVSDVHTHQLGVEIDEALPFRRPKINALGPRHGDGINLGLRRPLEERVLLGEINDFLSGHSRQSSSSGSHVRPQSDQFSFVDVCVLRGYILFSLQRTQRHTEKQQQRKNESTRICASVPSPSARLRLSFQYRTRLHRGPARA